MDRLLTISTVSTGKNESVLCTFVIVLGHVWIKLAYRLYGAVGILCCSKPKFRTINHLHRHPISVLCRPPVAVWSNGFCGNDPTDPDYGTLDGWTLDSARYVFESLSPSGRTGYGISHIDQLTGYIPSRTGLTKTSIRTPEIQEAG